MSVIVDIAVEDVATRLLTYTKIELERATAVAGSYSEVTELTLVEDDLFYTYTDTTGTLSSWYRYRFSNAGETVRSDYSNPFQVRGVDRKKIRQKALTDYRAGAVMAASASGNSTTVLDTDDYRLNSTLYDAGRGKGGWVYAIEGSSAGQVSRIITPVPSNGQFTISPALTDALTSGQLFEWHWLADPIEWNLAINRGLLRYWYLERTSLLGNDGVEQALSYIPWLRSSRQVTGLWYAPLTDGAERAWGSSGKWWDVRSDAGYLTLLTNIPITAEETVYLEALRQADELHTDASVAPVQVDLELAAAFAYDEILSLYQEPAHPPTDKAPYIIAQRRHRKNRLARLIDMYKPRPLVQPRGLPRPVGYASPWSAR